MMPKTAKAIKIDLAAHLPPTYISDDQQRIDLYRRMASALRQEEIEEIAEEMKDRFGPLPEEALNLIEIVSLKIWARNAKILRIEVSDGKVIAERNGRKLTTEGRFPRLPVTRGRGMIREIRRSLEKLIR